MAQEIKTVLVVGGASGNLGPFVVKELVATGAFDVTVLSRESSSASSPSASAKLLKSDFSYPSLVSAFKGQDAVVSTVATLAIGSQTPLVDAAVEAGVKRFIPSEYGTNTSKDRALELVPPLRGKRAIVDYLKKKESTGLTWTSIITGPFFDWGLVRMPFPYLPFNIPARTATLPTPKSLRDIKVSHSTLPQIGRAVASTILPSHVVQTQNQYILTRSFSISQNELLAAFEKVTGEKWKVEDDVPDEEKYKQAAEKLNQGDFSVFGQLITTAFYDQAAGGYFDVEKEYANEILELPQESLEDVVRAAVKEVEGKKGSL